VDGAGAVVPSRLAFVFRLTQGVRQVRGERKPFSLQKARAQVAGAFQTGNIRILLSLLLELVHT